MASIALMYNVPDGIYVYWGEWYDKLGRGNLGWNDCKA